MATTESIALVLLRMNLRGSADWRRRKAGEHPRDAVRNLAAASVLDRLAATVKDIHPDYAIPYLELTDGSADDALRIAKTEQEMIKAAGFDLHWESAEEFVKEMIARARLFRPRSQRHQRPAPTFRQHEPASTGQPGAFDGYAGFRSTEPLGQSPEAVDRHFLGGAGWNGPLGPLRLFGLGQRARGLFGRLERLASLFNR